MLENEIKNLINYAKYHLNLNENDEIYIRNRLLETLHEEEFEEELIDSRSLIDVTTLTCPDVVIKPLIDAAIKQKIIIDSEREFFLCKLLDIVSLRPSEVIEQFNNHYQKAPLDAFQWLEKYNIANDYIKSTDIARNVRWTAENTAGKLVITINLSKPEKSHSEVKKNITTVTKYPKCVICPENEGYVGGRTTRQNLRGIPITLKGEKWFWQFSPYAYFNQHGIAINYRHTPMAINSETTTKLLDFVDYNPSYFIGCNAALPIIGGSILSHDHFQGGLEKMPMHYAQPRYRYIVKEFPDVQVSILEWYNSVIQLKSVNRDSIDKLARKIISSWKKYDDYENGIIARTEAQHNSITLIVRKDKEQYIVDMILRNNRTTDEYPEGLFHAHQEYYNVKSEAIGLIEAMGLFILPARLKRQMVEINNYLCGMPYDSSLLTEDMQIHQEMIERLINLFGSNNNEEKAELIIKDEIARVCECILDNTAVFKNSSKGIAGFKKFMQKLNMLEV